MAGIRIKAEIQRNTRFSVANLMFFSPKRQRGRKSSGLAKDEGVTEEGLIDTLNNRKQSAHLPFGRYFHK
jgi:hypothetical protein